MLVNWFYTKETQTSHIFMSAGGFATWSKVMKKVQLLPIPPQGTHRLWETGMPSILLFTFQWDGCQVFEKDIPGSLSRQQVHFIKKIMYFLKRPSKKWKLNVFWSEYSKLGGRTSLPLFLIEKMKSLVLNF